MLVKADLENGSFDVVEGVLLLKYQICPGLLGTRSYLATAIAWTAP